MAFSSALAIRVLSRSDISTVADLDSPPSGGFQRAPRAWMSHFVSNRPLKRPPVFPDLTIFIQVSVVVLCQSSAMGRVRICTHISSPWSLSSLARVPVMPANGSTSKESNVLMGRADDSVRVSSAEYTMEWL